MFANEPFFLNEEQQEFMIVECYGTDDIKQTDVLPLKTFLKKMKPYIGQQATITDDEET